jgi:hypothetical protein
MRRLDQNLVRAGERGGKSERAERGAKEVARTSDTIDFIELHCQSE